MILSTEFVFGLTIGMQWCQVDGARSSSAAPEMSSSSGGRNNSSSSSSEEEWQDEGMDFTQRPCVTENTSAKVNAKEASSGRSNAKPDGRRRKVDSKGTRAAAVPAARGTRSSARDRTRAAAAAAAAAAEAAAASAMKADDRLPSSCSSMHDEVQESGDMDAVDEGEHDQYFAERDHIPPPLLSPGGVYDAVCLVRSRVCTCGERNITVGKSDGRLVIAGARGVGK